MLPQRKTQHGLEQDRSATQLLKDGVAAFRAGDKDHARELIAEAAELAPDNELAWMWSASTARNRSEALAALGRALEINPDNAKARQWVERLTPAMKPAEAKSPAPAAPQSKAAAAAAAASVSEAPPASSPAPVESAPVPAPESARKPAVDDGDPLRALLRNKLGLPEETPARRTQTEQAPATAAQPVETEQPADAVETAHPAPQTEQPPVAEQIRAAAPVAAARPISQQTCLLCGKHSLKEGVCGFCRAVGDLGRLDEISRNENVDRSAMLGAVERFRKELDAGPSFEANLGLALAYLNLKQSNDALPRLAEACRLQPDNAELRRQYEQLRARRLILVVDDSRTVQRMIAGVLEKELYRVTLAEDGLQALARLDDETPSLILLDITMPRMDGYQVAKIITGNDATAAIPVVMLSGKDGFFDRIRGKMVGAKGYVTKPFDPDELIETIRRCLDS